MSSTIQAFNTMLKNFLEELQVTFPEETKVAVVIQSFDDLAAINVRKPMQLFVAALAPHANLVTTRNPALFNQPIELPGGLDMSKLWNAEGVTQNSRDAIWQYITMLFMLGTTVENLPQPLLETIENVAMSCAQQMGGSGAGAMGDIDISALSNMLMGGLGDMLGGGRGASTAKPRRTTPAKPKRLH